MLRPLRLEVARSASRGSIIVIVQQAQGLVEAGRRSRYSQKTEKCAVADGECKSHCGIRVLKVSWSRGYRYRAPEDTSRLHTPRSSLKFNATRIASSIRKETRSGNLMMTVATIDAHTQQDWTCTSTSFEVLCRRILNGRTIQNIYQLYAIDEQEYASKTINKLPH